MKAFGPLKLNPISDEPLVSVLMSNYNYGKYIGEAIESVIAQEYRHFELIVCDDGSTDNSCAIVSRYRDMDARITLLRKANGGQASGYNAGFAMSKGAILCFLDADDVYLPGKLARVVAAFRVDSQAGFVGHRLLRVDERRKPIGISPLLAKMPSGWQGEYMLGNAGFLEYLAPGGGLCLRREIAEHIFPLPEKGLLSRYGDAPLMRLAPLMTRLAVVDDALAEWRCHGSNFSHKRRITADYLRRELNIYWEFWRMQSSCLSRLWGTDVAARLAPLHCNSHVAQMEYILAKLDSDNARDAWRRFLAKQQTKKDINEYLRWFWRLSIVLPRWAFSFFINMLLGPSSVKEVLGTGARMVAQRKLVLRGTS
jgi:glycosyltransferase involved in cell wall biosynthesis